MIAIDSVGSVPESICRLLPYRFMFAAVDVSSGAAFIHLGKTITDASTCVTTESYTRARLHILLNKTPSLNE